MLLAGAALSCVASGPGHRDVPLPAATISVTPPVSMAPAPSAAATTPEVDVFDARFPETARWRCRLAHLGTLRWVDGGPPAREPDPKDPSLLPRDELVVISETASSVRVLKIGRGIRVALFVDRAALWPTPTRRTRLRSAPRVVTDTADASEPPFGVWVRPGAMLEVGERDGDVARVRGGFEAFDPVQFGGWMKASDLGTLYEGTALTRRKAGDARVLQGAQLRDGPGGPVLAIFSGPEPGHKADWTHLVEWRTGAPPGYAVIRYASPSVEVVGLVAAAEAQPTAARIQGWGYSTHGPSGVMSHTRRAFLRAGAKLYATGTQERAGGEAALVHVGTADGNFSVYVEPRPVGGLSLVHVYVPPFGNLDALVSHSCDFNLSGASREARRRRSRTRTAR